MYREREREIPHDSPRKGLDEATLQVSAMACTGSEAAAYFPFDRKAWQSSWLGLEDLEKNRGPRHPRHPRQRGSHILWGILRLRMTKKSASTRL